MAFCSRCGVYIAEGSKVCPACGAPVPGEEKEGHAHGFRQGKRGGASAAQAAPESESTGEQARQAETDSRQSGYYHHSYRRASRSEQQDNPYSNTQSQSTGSQGGAGRSSGESRQTYQDAYRTYANQRYGAQNGQQYHYGYQHQSRTPREEYCDPYDARSNRGLGVLSYFGLLLLVPYLLRPGSPFIRFHCNQGLLMLLLGIASSAVMSFPVFGWLAGAAGWIFTVVCFFTGISNVLSGRMRELPLIGRFRLLR